MTSMTQHTSIYYRSLLVLLLLACCITACEPKQFNYRDNELVEDDYLLRKVPQTVAAKAQPLDAIDFVGREPAMDSADLAADHPTLDLAPDTEHNDTLPDFTTARHVMYWIRPEMGLGGYYDPYVIGIVWPAEGNPEVFYAIVMTP
jgi:hypothetical protein